MSQAYETLLIEKKGQVDWVTMNRPGRRSNALNTTLVDELLDYFGKLYFDRSVRIVVLRGAGRAFSAGLDLKQSALWRAPESERAKGGPRWRPARPAPHQRDRDAHAPLRPADHLARAGARLRRRLRAGAGLRRPHRGRELPHERRLHSHRPVGLRYRRVVFPAASRRRVGGERADAHRPLHQCRARAARRSGFAKSCRTPISPKPPSPISRK